MALPAIRDAATVILVRGAASETPRVLMGRRGARAAFLPGKYVFPGGAVDPTDHGVPLGPLPAPLEAGLSHDSACAPAALVAAAVRELWEETGQVLGAPGPWDDAPRGWRGFAASGHRPDAASLSLLLRAVTPPGRPRRFDARILAADADALASDPDDFSRAEDELTDLRWLPLPEARALDLPFITRIALAEMAARLPALSQAARVPVMGRAEAFQINWTG